VSCILQLGSAVSCLRVDQTSAVNKVRTLERSLNFLLNCQQPLKALHAQLTDDAADDDATLRDEAVKLASIIESRLQATLLNLVKNLSTTGKNRYVSYICSCCCYRYHYWFQLLFSRSFLPARHYASVVFATATCLSVCLSGHLSVTRGIMPSRVKAGSWNVHCLIAPWF